MHTSLPAGSVSRFATALFSLVFALLSASSTLGADAPADLSPGYVGTPQCAACHRDAFEAWQGSHHDLAMQKPTAETVLGDFADARFEHFGVTTEFYRRGDAYMVRTDGPDGKPTEYEVAWVFGVEPLQQYLLPLDDGRLQALTVAWDSRPAAEGGQRWYHLYPDEAIANDDPLHWTGPYQNWNTRCAECHSTDVQKNYDVSTRSFDTQFFEEDVGCEACHGPGSRHVALAKGDEFGADSTSAHEAYGFLVDLAARGQWTFPGDESIARRLTPLEGQEQIDTCGRCHARRGTLGPYEHGKSLSHTHRLSLLGVPLYHADGQILDEVYVYGSFVQSKMHQAGVVCSNCHEPHSNRLRAEGNGVCAQCHKPSVYDRAEHHHHPLASAGAQCVNCHMPSEVYMGVDPRRDHSMRVPRPDLSVMTGTPNACNGCHENTNADWALEALRAWSIEFRDTANHPAVAFHALQQGDERGVPTLVSFAGDPQNPGIWRATALERTAATGNQEALRLALELLQSPDPLLRVSAVRALQLLPIEQRYGYLAPLAQDPVSGVRLEVAMSLAEVPLERIDENARESLRALFDEYRRVQREHADMPSVNLQSGLFNLARGDYPGAEMAYREALDQNPQLLPARLNLADLLRASGREDEARDQLQQALKVNPQSGDALHALGLLEARTGNSEAALTWLGQAASLDTATSRHRFVYAIAQHDYGDIAAALVTLQRLHADLPADEQTILAIVNYSVEAGDPATARRYAKKLLPLAPENTEYRQLLESLEK